MINTVVNQPYNFPSPDLTKFTEQWRRKYYALVYQGDVSEVSRAENSLAFKPTDFIPTGSICQIESDTGFGIPYLVDDPDDEKKNVAIGNACPYFVMVGNDKQEVYSEIGNVAGGKITAIPCDGYFRVRTTLFDTSVKYQINDFLTVKLLTDPFSGRKVTMVTRLDPDKDVRIAHVVVGQVTQLVRKNKEGLDSLSFSLHFIPASFPRQEKED